MEQKMEDVAKEVIGVLQQKVVYRLSQRNRKEKCNSVWFEGKQDNLSTPERKGRTKISQGHYEEFKRRGEGELRR